MAVAERIDITYDFTPKAQEIIYASDPEVIIEGPAGTSKTFSMMWHAHLCLLKYPGSRVLLFRKVGQDLTTGALDTYHKGVNPFVQGVKTYGGSKFLPAQYLYPNGSVLIPAGLDKADKVLSSEFDMALGNEITNGVTEDDWQTVKTRLRNGKMPFQQLMGDCNPSHARHWAKQRCDSGKARNIKTTHQDNPAYWDQDRKDWTEAGKRYVENILGSLTGVRRDRLLLGLWNSSEGLVYQFDTSMEVKNLDIDLTGWRRVMSCDIGGTNPTAILNGYVSGDERIHISKCLYRRGMSASDIVAAIVQQFEDHQPDTVFIDPSAKLIKDDLLRIGIPVVGADNSIEEGIRQVQSVLQRGFSCDPDECADMIAEFGMYSYKANPRIETDKPIKADDHTMDALRYMVVGVTEPVFDLQAFYEGSMSYA